MSEKSVSQKLDSSCHETAVALWKGTKLRNMDRLGSAKTEQNSQYGTSLGRFFEMETQSRHGVPDYVKRSFLHSQNHHRRPDML